MATARFCVMQHTQSPPTALDVSRPVAAADERTPYQYPMPYGSIADLVVGDLFPDDERAWVPQSEFVSFRPLVFGVSQGFYVNLLRVRQAGVLSRHRHSGPVHAIVLKGSWHYLEHDWVATEGSFAFEPPGEVHTLVVPDDVDEMITFFHVTGTLVYVDPYGRATGYDDVFTKLELARSHYEAVGLGAAHADRYIR
jgi:2,4'-dihydroxyacetophenone dioxygenase